MTRWETEHAIRCSLRIERMTATFCRRIDRSATFLQIVLGMAVFADFANTKVIGAGVALLSVWIFVYSPASKAIAATQQQQNYEALCIKMSSLSDVVLADEFVRAGDHDSEEIGFITKAAENAEHMNAQSSEPYKLNYLEKMLLWIAGG